MQILLTTLNAKYIHANLAIRLLYQLTKDTKKVSWKEFGIKENPDDIAKNCEGYDVVAFSCYIWNITQTLIVAQKLKESNPNIKILLGGPEVSYEYETIINLPAIDYIIQGEGEIPFTSFVNSYPEVALVPGIIFKSSKGIQKNPLPANFDLSLYANILPYSNDPVKDLKPKVLYLETSRGCPYKCEFCLASLDNKVRYLPMDQIKQNLKYMMDHGRVIKFLDRTFNVKKDFTLDIFRFILEHHQPGNVFQFEITADILHADIIKFINEEVPPGLFRFEIGIQTINQKANLEVSRKQNFEKTKSIILQVQDKVELHLDLIVGLALDYFEDIKYSFEEVFKLFAPELQLGFLKFLKGTPVRDKHQQHGFVFDPNPPYQIIRSNYLSEHELARIVKLEHALEIYWNKKAALNTLRYVTDSYGIFDFLEGLGTSFGEKRDYHHYSLNDVYEILFEFVNTYYPTDKTLHDLVVADYYLRSKIKPKLQFREEADKETFQHLFTEGKLNKSLYRYLILPISHQALLLLKQGNELLANNLLIVQYDGVNAPVLR